MEFQLNFLIILSSSFCTKYFIKKHVFLNFKSKININTLDYLFQSILKSEILVIKKGQYV